jgi:hypothetical protein
MLKRWRDHNQDAHSAIKSIILQVLISDHLDGSSSDGERIAKTLSSVSEFANSQASVPVIPNPVLESENLAGRWSDEEFRSFCDVIVAAAATAGEALDLPHKEACEKWRELFGKDFPLSEGGTDSSSSPAPGTTRRIQSAPRHGGWG